MNNENILSKFSPEFQSTIPKDPFANVVLSALESGGDPYRMIESLLKINRSMNEELMELRLENIREKHSVKLAGGELIEVHNPEK